MKNIKIKLDEFLTQLDKMGVNYSVDRNPSPEKVSLLKEAIENRVKREKEAQAIFRSLEEKN